ncbi:hypothetical protein V1514DRAFT_326269 [Lipomyces japonicus]|uniref:mitochondrial 37S ribosomal protein uS17m n=1 Tax=Lipomyces japonicus TaxID=56871 RepID=UPI0034CD062B
MRQNFLGVVVSHGKMAKTVKVRVQQPVFSQRYNRLITNRKDYLVHDEAEVCREGDIVRIESTRPLSARKFFAIAEIKNDKGQKLEQFEKQSKFQEEKQANESLLELKRLCDLGDLQAQVSPATEKITPKQI